MGNRSRRAERAVYQHDGAGEVGFRERRCSMTRRRSAFTVTELLVAIGLFALIAVVASTLTWATVRVSHEAGYGQSAAQQFDGATRQLRRDVWAAESIDVKANHATVTFGDDGGSVEWTLEPDG